MSEQRIRDDILDDWYARWPSILPTSVPHEQVRMLIEDLRDCRAALRAAEAERDALREEVKLWRWIDSEMSDVHPCPDLAMRAQWRRDARAIRAANERRFPEAK